MIPIKLFKSTCCECAENQLNMWCDEHQDRCPDKVLSYCRGIKSDFFGLIAINATYQVFFCPFCGKNLKENCILESIQK